MTIKDALLILERCSWLKIGPHSVTASDHSTAQWLRSRVRRRVGESLESMVIRAAESFKPYTWSPEPLRGDNGKGQVDGCATCHQPSRGLIWAGKKIGWQCPVCNDFAKAPAHQSDLIGPVKGEPQ